eukprot:CAMPEP_0168164016 /NCGR_PEP_ID=MMETSP0139_2-20121125/698_1 /TAXON_ID=44445 /ORGANISM="Pseudo-nitzschia australis, Strain 10249 10 AB" /LENGTH=552 /DNA_ID=CAMNT_0008080977 /DNA_START=266 /DNA_END=1921 /DNA_ORIENTATION=+
MFLAFGLSVSLFGLTTMEALPTSTHPNSLFSQEDAGTLSFAYWVVLWLLSIHIVLIVPSLVGSSLGMSFGRYICCTSTTSSTRKTDGKSSYATYLPWWIRFAWRLGFGLLFIVFNTILYNGLLRVSRCLCFSNRPRRNSNTHNLPVLPLRDESVRCSPSSREIQHHDKPAPPKNNNKLSLIDCSSSSTKNHQHEYEYSYSENQNTSRQQRFFAILGGIGGIVATLGFLSSLGPLVVQPPSEYETTLLSLVVSWICALGFLISSVLNGFGSVSLPYANLSGFFLQVRPDYIAKLEAELNSLEETLTKKRTMLKERKVEIETLSPLRGNTSRSPLAGSSGTSNSFSMSSMLTTQNNNNGLSELGDELRIRRQILQTEIGFMEDLVRETTLDLEELKDSQVTATAARSSIGKTKSYVGILFSVILLARLLIAGFSIFRSHSHGTLLSTDFASDHRHHKKSHSDVVTSTLLWLTGHKYFSHNQYNTLSQMVSLVLSVGLSFSQMRLFLRTATIVHRRLSGFYKNCFNGGDAIGDGIGSLAAKNSSEQRQPTVTVLW